MGSARTTVPTQFFRPYLLVYVKIICIFFTWDHSITRPIDGVPLLVAEQLSGFFFFMQKEPILTSLLTEYLEINASSIDFLIVIKIQKIPFLPPIIFNTLAFGTLLLISIQHGFGHQYNGFGVTNFV